MTATPTVKRITNAPDGIVRLFVPESLDVTRQELRTIVARIVGNPTRVGKTPDPVPTSYKGLGAGHRFDFAPVTTVAPKAPAKAPAKASTVAPVTFVEPSKAERKAAKRAAKAKAAKGASSFVADVIAPRAAAKAEQAKACKTCLGFGRTRKTPRTRKDGTPVTSYPFAFRTANGAASAVSFETCKTCKGKTSRRTA